MVYATGQDCKAVDLIGKVVVNAPDSPTTIASLPDAKPVAKKPRSHVKLINVDELTNPTTMQILHCFLPDFKR